MSPPGGETAPTTVTEPSPPPSVTHVPGPLVEGRQRRGEAGRVALLGGQRPGARGELAQRLRPPRRGVGDDHGVQPHVAEVLGHRHAGVDARLAGHHRHVRRVRDDHGALGEPPAGPRVHQLGQLGDDVGHLVAALAAADVDDHVGGAPLGDLLEQHRLAGAEPAGHRGRAAQGHRVQQVEHPLAGEQRLAAVEPARGTGVAGAPATAALMATGVPPTTGEDGVRRRSRRPRRRSSTAARRPLAARAPAAAAGRLPSTVPRASPAADLGRRGRDVGLRTPRCAGRPARPTARGEPGPRAGQRSEQPVEDAAEQPGSERCRQRLAPRDGPSHPGPVPRCTRRPARWPRSPAEGDHLARAAAAARAPPPRTSPRPSSPSTSTSGPLTRTTRPGCEPDGPLDCPSSVMAPQLLEVGPELGRRRRRRGRPARTARVDPRPIRRPRPARAPSPLRLGPSSRALAATRAVQQRRVARGRRAGRTRLPRPVGAAAS